MADVLTPLPVKTKANGDIVIKIVDTAGTNIASVSASNALKVDGSAVTQPISGTVTANAGTGDFLSIFGHTRNEAFKESAAVGGELDDTAPVAATEGNVSPVRITAQRAFHVNLRKNDGTELGTAADPVVISADAPASPQIDTLTSASLAAGANVDLAGTQISSGKTGKLAQVIASSSVPIKITISTVLNGTPTTRVIGFVKAGEPFIYPTPHKDFITVAEDVTAGIDGFRVNITNMDNNEAADVYATILYDEV